MSSEQTKIIQPHSDNLDLVGAFINSLMLEDEQVVHFGPKKDQFSLIRSYCSTRFVSLFHLGLSC